MGKMPLPTEEQAKLLRSAGVDPEGMVIQVDNGDYICCMRLKTRDEITARFAKRKRNVFIVENPKPPTEEQAKLLRSAGILPDKVAVVGTEGDYMECMSLETGNEISVHFNKTIWRYYGHS